MKCDFCGNGMCCSLAERDQKDFHTVADKLSDVWLCLDAYARGEMRFTPDMAKAILIRQQCPGWKDGDK